MHFSPATLVATAALLCAPAVSLFAQDEPVTPVVDPPITVVENPPVVSEPPPPVVDNSSLRLASETGAAIAFTPDGDGWKWTSLTMPGRNEPWALTDEGTPISAGADAGLKPVWELMPQDDSSKLVFEQQVPDAGLRFRRVFSFGAAGNVLRIETAVRATDGDRVLTRAGLLDLTVAGEGFYETGEAPASFPVFGQSLFVGIEHVSGEAHSDGETVHLWQNPHASVGDDWQPIATVVVGWVRPGDVLNENARVRAAFLQYLDTVRIKPADLELHTNTWWTLPLPFTEKDVLADIDALRQGFADRTGMFFDSFALDLGWSDPHSIWQVNAKNFPNEFRTINERLAASGAGLGIWVSPGSAYPPGLDNKWLKANGYELTPFGDPHDELNEVACMALGTRYQREFKQNLLRLVRDYGIRHVKFDFMAHRCDEPSHGHPTGRDSFYAIDAGFADVLDSLRALNPNIVLEPLCAGYPPSPWWLMHTPYVLAPDGDDVPYGRVASPEWMESLITARDIAYRSDQERWIMPTAALESFDIVRQSPGDFENLAVMAIGRGRWFLSTYLKPGLMTPQNWDFLAALVRWARANKQYLGNALQIGGRPENREAYGFMFHNPTKDIYCARNPWMEEREIELPQFASVTEPRELRMIYPRRQLVARLEPGAAAPRLTLAPYETVMLETVPAPEVSGAPATVSIPLAALTAGEPDWFGYSRNDDSNAPTDMHFSWSGSITVPDAGAADLYILVQGSTAVSAANCTVSIGGRGLKPVRATSAGQFGAAGSPSPDNWTWFTVPVTPGAKTFTIDVDVPATSATFGVYLRGSTPAVNDPAPEDGPVFPLYHPDTRRWSQTLLPLKDCAVEPTEDQFGGIESAGPSVENTCEPGRALN